MGVPVDAAAKAFQAIVRVNDRDALDAEKAIKLAQGLPVRLLGADIVAGRKCMTRVQADTDPFRLPDAFEDCGQMFETMSEARPLAGSIFEQNSYRRANLVQSAVECFSHARNALFLTCPHVGSGVKYDAGDSEEIGTPHLIDKGCERLLVKQPVGRGEVDKVAAVGYDRLYSCACLRLNIAFAVFRSEKFSLPLIAVFQEDLHCPASSFPPMFECPMNASCDGHVSACQEIAFHRRSHVIIQLSRHRGAFGAMTDRFSILLVGLKAPAEPLAVGHFTQAGHGVTTAASPSEAREKTPRAEIIYLQPTSDSKAVEELKQLISICPGPPVALICAQASGPVMLEAWQAGAADIMVLPLTPQSLTRSLERMSRQIPARESAPPTEAQARFRYLDEMGKQHWASMIPPKFTIGRSSSNDLVLTQMSISRAHAEVVVQDGEYLLKDLGSKHGTYVNGNRVDQVKLNNGDHINLGGLQGPSLTFHQGDLLQSLLGISDSKTDLSLSVKGFKEIGMLLATFRALSSIPLLDDLLALVVDTAIELTGAERGFIMLKDEREDLVFRCARNSFKRPLDGSFFQTSRRVPDEVFRTGQRIVINDLDLGDNTGEHSSTRRLGLRSIFCVPLRYLAFQDSGNLSGLGRMETIGVLYVDSQSIGAGLSNTQIDALETLASEAAMAIYNARLYKDSQEKRRMDEQLAIAREIQQALLPNPNKDLPFVRACSQNLPCHEVGGDYFDYFDLDDGKFGFALGDVAGKGMPAALLTSMIQGMFSAQSLLEAPLPTVISNVNRNLARRGTGNRFVTFFFGILDPEGNCTYVNAGHNPPLLLRSDGSLIELKEGGGMVLGLFAQALYESRTVRLHPGDHLVLFTDGVLEARNTTGEEFEQHRLRAVLSQNAQAGASQILTRLREAVLKFSANTPQHDDITMMVLGFREEEHKPN